MLNLDDSSILKPTNSIKIGKKSEEIENSGEKPFTFKITKKRSPWTQEEDDAITALVNKYGTINWTVIAIEMASDYGFKHRSGKQCRERWHNHLDPSINKDYWTEKEENILFMKHIEYGNRWSDIAKFLPGRTDNAIKNHFYSKLRKFIRKILKNINKDGLLKNMGIDPNKYNSDKIYKMIKKFKIPYNNLTKESIMNMIFNFEKNTKNPKFENNFLKSKTNRKKIKQKENVYSEKINQRNVKKTHISTGQRKSSRMIKRREYDNSEYQIKRVTRTSRDYQQDARIIKKLSDEKNDLNIIVDKNILDDKTNDIVEKHDFIYENLSKAEIDYDSNYNLNKNYIEYYTNDFNQPILSPINYRNQLYPNSTKNHFNIDILNNFEHIKRSPICEKNINMQNKILINEIDGRSFSFNEEYEEKFSEKKVKKRLSIDMEVVNKSDTIKIFKDCINNSYKDFNEDNVSFITPINKENECDKKKIMLISPAAFSISPKSAFVIRK